MNTDTMNPQDTDTTQAGTSQADPTADSAQTDPRPPFGYSRRASPPFAGPSRVAC